MQTGKICDLGKCLSFFLIIFFSSDYLLGQSNMPVFLALQPGLTVEPFYEDGELDVNTLPIVVEASINNRVNVKASPIVNYHFGGDEQGISDLGLFVVVPIFLKAKESLSDRPHGFYLGPVLGVGRNILRDHFTTTIAVEPGYFFKAERSFSLSIGLQLGGSYFSYDKQTNEWLTHWGPKVSFGYWIR